MVCRLRRHLHAGLSQVVDRGLQKSCTVTLLITLAIRNSSLSHSKLEASLILLILIKAFESGRLVLNRIFVSHQARIGQTFVVEDLTRQKVVPVLALRNLVMGKRLLVLAQVVVALACTHVKSSVTTVGPDLTLPVRLLVERSGFIEDGRAEVIESSLVVVHHHVALATLVVGHGELWIVHTSGGKEDEGLIDQLTLIFIGHLGLICPLAAFCLLQLLHKSFSICVLAHPGLLLVIWVLGTGDLSLRGCLTLARHVTVGVCETLVSTNKLYILSHDFVLNLY